MGSTLTLIVSNGPAQRAVPAGLEGQPKDAVVNALKQLRLNPQLKEEFHETVAKDAVIAVDPPAGTKLDVDAVVTLTVSKGPEPKPIPNVVGLTVAEATTRIEAAGFKVKGVTGSTSRTVLISDPPAGERHPAGTQIQLIMRSS
jgi:serine/threonine-protein kinase